MVQKIMFVGAGPYQLKGIQKAKSMGLRIVATDGNSKAPGLTLADEPHVVDVRDIKGQVRLAHASNIDGVLAVASEASLRTVAAICEDLGLPGVKPNIIEVATDKGLMRKAFHESGVPSPKFRVVFNEQEAIEAIRTIGFPAVIKPVDSAGSRGVRFINHEHELQEVFSSAQSFSLSNKVIIEEFMNGTEISVEAFVDDGEIKILAMSDKVRTSPPYLLDIEVIFPCACNGVLRDETIDIAKRAIRAVGIDYGPVHAEIMLTSSGPVPVELAARGPGFKVFTDIIPSVTGIDTLRAIIDIALGRRPQLIPDRDKASVIRFLEAESGIVKDISGIDHVRQILGIYEVEVYVKIGDRVSPLTSGQDRIGHIISLADSRDDALRIIEQAIKSIQVQVE